MPYVCPSTELGWLGFKINTVDMTVTIPEAKLKEVVDEEDRLQKATSGNSWEATAYCKMRETS